MGGIGADDVEDDFLEQGQILRCVVLADRAAILSETDIENPMKPVLDRPVRLDHGCEVFCAQVARADVVALFQRGFPIAYPADRVDAANRLALGPFRDAWRNGQRCIIPAWSFDEPCWETGRNIWWRFRRLDGQPWGLAGLWNTWVDRATGEVVESYTMLTVNADAHPLMSRMHKPDPKLPADQQDKRSVVAIEPADVEQWLQGKADEAAELLAPPALALIGASPVKGNAD
jgi:hypothetical protein